LYGQSRFQKFKKGISPASVINEIYLTSITKVNIKELRKVIYNLEIEQKPSNMSFKIMRKVGSVAQWKRVGLAYTRSWG
jgi:hypothetical protein